MNSHTNKAYPVTLDDIKDAARRIASEIIRTPLVLSDAASERAGMDVYLKLENMQHAGAFKVRGALSKVTNLSPEDIQRGLICASSGNHGLGVAYASARFGAHCIVVLPEHASLYKISLLKKLGADIILCGTTSDVRQQKVDQLSLERGFMQIHLFADPVLIAGQGTVGLEVLESLPQVDEVYVPLGAVG